MCSSWTCDTGAGIAQHVSFCERVCCERVLPGFPGSCQLYSDSPFAFIFHLQRKKPSSFELDTNLLAQIFFFLNLLSEPKESHPTLQDLGVRHTLPLHMGRGPSAHSSMQPSPANSTWTSSPSRPAQRAATGIPRDCTNITALTRHGHVSVCFALIYHIHDLLGA